MAMDKPKRRRRSVNEPVKEPGDLAKLAQSIQEHPVAYILGLAFVLVCMVVGLVVRASSEAASMEAATEYAKAMEAEDDAEKMVELEETANAGGAASIHALYMLGETAFKERDYPKARECFTKLRESHPDSEFVPDAVEGLGYILEAEEDWEGARAKYEEILEAWPGSFAARRQQLNIGRVLEKLGDPEGAVAAYREQSAAFPESRVAGEAQDALERLSATNPELFPSEPEAGVEAVPSEGESEVSPETPELRLSIPEDDGSPSMEDQPDGGESGEAAAPAPEYADVPADEGDEETE